MENDIKKEKSALLQSIRYIVQNNFFKGPEPDDGLLVNPYAGAVDKVVEEGGEGGRNESSTEVEDELDYGDGDGDEDGAMVE